MSSCEWEFTGPKRTSMRGPALAIPLLLLGAREAASALGICERTLWTLTKSGQVPHIRVGRRVLYDPDDLRAWVKSRRQTPEFPSHR